MIKFIFFILLIPFVLFTQEVEEENIWEPLEFFIGTWTGDETGKAGIGKGERTYQFIMGKKYIFQKNISRFEPQEKNPEGETHEDWGFFSYDKVRKNFVLREFHIEGFVNQYILDSLASDTRTLVFTSEISENSPEGLRARITFKIKNKDEFTEIFEIAMPGKDYSIWLRNFWRRLHNRY